MSCYQREVNVSERRSRAGPLATHDASQFVGRGGVLAGGLLLAVPGAARGASTTGLNARERGTCAALVDTLRAVPGNPEFPATGDVTSAVNGMTASDPVLLAHAQRTLADLENLPGTSFAGLSIAGRLTQLRLAAYAGMPSADPGFTSTDEQSAFLEKLSTEVRASASAAPDTSAVQASSQGNVETFFGAREPFPAPDPTYDPTKSLKFTAGQIRLHDLVGSAINLVAAAIPAADPHRPLGV